MFAEDDITDQAPPSQAEEMVREQLFMRLRKEVPYEIRTTIVAWKVGKRPDQSPQSV